MQIKVYNVSDKKIKRSFEKVMRRYTSLHDYEVTLSQEGIKTSTMQAQPIIDFKGLISGVKRYKVKLAKHVRDTETLLVKDLPEDVLTGWFAHELGHIVDYERYSNFGMIFYGIKYLLSSKFRVKVENAADYIAINHDFQSEIIATKRYILEHDLLEENYKNKIRKYYLSIEQVEMCTKDSTPLNPTIDIIGN